jgi:hypothetical protein
MDTDFLQEEAEEAEGKHEFTEGIEANKEGKRGTIKSCR